MDTTAQEVAPGLDAARAAAARHAWRDAVTAYEALDADTLAPADLEAYATALWWIGGAARALDLRERAYAGFLAAGDKAGAARLALTLADDHSSRGDTSVALGWFATAERLLEGLPEVREHARYLAVRGMVAGRLEGDVESALRLFDEAIELAERLDDRDTAVLARSGKAAVLVQLGDVDAGLALHDSTTAAAAGGAADPFALGVAYCATISSCHDVGDLRRAAEWTEAANRWCDRFDVSGFPGICRLHQAEIMCLRGAWPTAEAQAEAACVELHEYDRASTARGYYEIGEIRRKRGDFASAEDAFHQASELGHEPQPGLALLRLAQGKAQAAQAAVRRVLEHVQEPLARVKPLAAQVEIALAADDAAAARAAADELERIADAYGVAGARTVALAATLDLARGRLALADGDGAAAAAALRRARDAWLALDAPYETAQARLLLGLAYRRDDDDDAAATELEAALATFERLGAALDAERTKELLGRLEVRRTFVFTDIVDSTRLLETLGAEKWKRLLARHDELVSAALLQSGGELVKHTGDGVFAAFASAQAAIEAAVALQRALAAEVFAPDVRVGVHTGGAFHAEGDESDYGGQGVHVAARIGAAAGAGEILASAETLSEVAVPYGVSKPRSEPLKGIEAPIAVVSVDWR
ncbi:MAG TPA: adenylate/guanylate cyclase domain-containing protein [Gaiellaceae bacterium]|nr:adenylate/guanylate cyclase domain-containing protein [Gaiellaceae bacterium]